MKKFLSLTVLGVSLVSLAACGNSSSKTETKGSLDNEASKVLTVKHGNVRMIMLLLQQNFLTIVPLLSQFQLFLTFGILKSL